jgi:hypothetical protein
MSLGRIKFWMERLMAYISRGQFFMVVYLFLKESGISWYWTLGLIPLSAVILWVDKNYVIPGEFAAYYQLNPEWKKLMDKQDEAHPSV